MDPVTVTYRHIDRSAALTSRAMELARKLWRYNDRISECHLTIEGRHQQHSNGRFFAVKVDLHVPGAHIHAGNSDQHVDVYVALRDAIDDARRQLLQLSQRRGRQRIAAAVVGATKAGGAG